VLDGTIPQSMRKPVILLARQIGVGPVEQFQRLVIPPDALHMHVNRHVIVNVLTVVDRRSLDLRDGSVDFPNGVFLFSIHSIGWR
jgi:hypothetical protein